MEPPEAPPPTYVPSQPQILVVPLPESVSFFRGRSVEGEVFVKGLGESSSSGSGVKSLSVKLGLTDRLPPHEDVTLLEVPVQTLYPPMGTESTSSLTTLPFPSSHRFSIPLPPSSNSSNSISSNTITDPSSWLHPLPGTLDLSSHSKGEIRWTLSINLVLSSGEEIRESIKIEGTPPDLLSDDQDDSTSQQIGANTETEETLRKPGVKVRVVLDDPSPRLGDLLRLGVEVLPIFSEKSNLPGPSSAIDPREVLRPLRRVRVELFRRVNILHPSVDASEELEPQPSSSTSPPVYQGLPNSHLTLLHASGKSMRYPGPNPAYPPLRVLFTIPSPSLGTGSDPTWGEISMKTIYHEVKFFVRVTIGFGSGAGVGEASGSGEGSKDWVLEREIIYRPSLWTESGLSPLDDEDIPPDIEYSDDDIDELTEEETRAAYRLKGRDVVGSSGTTRFEHGQEGQDQGDLPPPFEQAGPSSRATALPPPRVGEGGLPTFLESEEQMRSGDTPLPPPAAQAGRQARRPITTTANLGELSTWVEYDGYETFSVQPPPMADSFGVGGSMDPPKEGDEDDRAVVGGMVARLGLGGGGHRSGGLELMEELGLGEGTRVVDLQDDLPPGIDEPSLPALPNFHTQPPSFIRRPSTGPHQPQPHAHPHQQPTTPDPDPESENLPPPSFDASEAAEAVGGTARAGEVGVGMSRQSSLSVGTGVVGAPGIVRGGEAPPGYFGQSGSGGGGGGGVSSGQGGLPPYSGFL